MLQYFFAAEINGKATKGLFVGLKIVQVDGGKYLEHQGKYPVILISFKGIKEPSFPKALDRLRFLVKELYRSYRFLLHSEKLEEDEKQLFQQLLEDNAEQAALEISLKTLSELLYKHYDHQTV